MCQELNTRIEVVGGPEAAAVVEKQIREFLADLPNVTVLGIQFRRSAKEIKLADVPVSDDPKRDYFIHRQLGNCLGRAWIRTVAELAAAHEATVLRLLENDKELLGYCKKILRSYSLDFAH
jgi:hypothetical protein